MRINFDDKSYIDFQNSNHPEKIMITILAKDQLNDLKNIVNSVEITREQLQELMDSIK